jgi:hypothetical protein
MISKLLCCHLQTRFFHRNPITDPQSRITLEEMTDGVLLDCQIPRCLNGPSGISQSPGISVCIRFPNVLAEVIELIVTEDGFPALTRCER